MAAMQRNCLKLKKYHADAPEAPVTMVVSPIPAINQCLLQAKDRKETKNILILARENTKYSTETQNT
jgi:hypothetical protein